MANYREDILNIELENGNLHRNFMRHTIGSGDALANRFGVRVFRNGEPVQLAGTCTGYFIRSDGATIPINNGVINGNVAYVTLIDTCYAMEGIFSLAIKVSYGGETVTMRIVDGMVSRTSTDVAIDPGTILPNIEDLIEAINEAVVTIPPDYSSLWNVTKHIGDELNQKNLYMPGAESGYTTGADTTYLYILTKGTMPVLIPKGSKIARINFVNSSDTHHSVALYFFERQGQNFKCVEIITGCSIDGGRVLDIDTSAFDTDVYIGIKNEIAYGIKFYEGVVSDRSSGTICAYTGAPSVGDVITPSRDANRYFAFNIRVDIFMPENREDSS